MQTEDIYKAIEMVAAGKQQFVAVADLERPVTMEDDDEPETLRDFIRSAFSDIGVEIEFSGKQQNERGVVIDINEELFEGLGFDVNTLRFGQTVVRVV